MIALLTGGHLLLQGLPGLATTLLVNTIAKAINLDFKNTMPAICPFLKPGACHCQQIQTASAATLLRRLGVPTPKANHEPSTATQTPKRPSETEAAFLSPKPSGKQRGKMQGKVVTLGRMRLGCAIISKDRE